LERSCVLRASGLVKAYGATVALNQVSLQVQSGEVRALLGENGAGKSTLVKTLSGIVRADAGQIEIGGVSFEPRSLMQARAAGVATAFQELSLLPNLSVADNLMLPRLVKGFAGRSTVKANRLAAAAILEEFGAADIPVEALVEELSLAQKQRIEIVRAFAQRPRLLILDEPTAALAEPQWLFGQIERVAAAGTGILYITHRMAEVRRLCSRATILRNGECVATVELDRVCDADIFAAMVGVTTVAHRAGANATASATSDVALAARDLTGEGVTQVNLELRRGEVLGVAALEGHHQHLRGGP